MSNLLVYVLRNSLVKARKEHVCDICKEMIPKGAVYRFLLTGIKGRPSGLPRFHHCIKCFEIESAK